ncbi:CAP domain-containing protein [Oceanobacillus saliphilus]|uniref:CAP domain-containing protein n=1 Tax=Oceanobacillus saliphilus TaxID=2925834 RepID=UPI00201E0090|nr:CAP domain-containing protein [Oceanobacillus saliphilus]
MIRSILLMTIIALIAFYFIERVDNNPGEILGNVTNVVKEKRNVLQSKIAPEIPPSHVPLEGNIFSLIGKTEQELLDELGEPSRIDPSAYDYKWWVYKDAENQYVQYGIEAGEIKTIYAIGENLETEPVHIGQTYDDIREQFTLTNEVTYSEGLSSYTFRLSEEDLAMRPLVKLNQDTFIQLYFDTFTNELSSLRILTAQTLLKHRPYEIEYRGKLPNEPNLSEEEWSDIETGMEQQIFDITNVMRHQQGKKKLDWEESVSNVAYHHSKDMADNNYFSHYSLNGDGLKERLEAERVFYIAAGENIAAQYPDAPAAMEGWLNSEGHREALLNDDYTHIGVGVFRFFYTQNFLHKPL